jgi:hypothetical protein
MIPPSRSRRSILPAEGEPATLGFMNEIAVHLRYQVANARGLSHCDINALNHHLRRTLHNRGGYVYPIELVAQRLARA